ncbi:unnamed protein product [Moneuplotes crassus]|uniref:AP2/ERF domain-containing protein n=1 Tax=Euplotes crassus TaxID=5936 RepID=A0AAD1Y4A3_EUPCR|nr:unnamed protein product [Moneuplotes crassus]
MKISYRDLGNLRERHQLGKSPGNDSSKEHAVPSTCADPGCACNCECRDEEMSGRNENPIFNFVPKINSMEEYCLCDAYYMQYFDYSLYSEYSTMMGGSMDLMSPQKLAPSLKSVRKRRRKNNLPDIDSHIQEVQSLIQCGELMHIESTSKNANALTVDNCKRRSRYTGVSRNGKNWQVLVNMGKEKKYIGSYTSEKEAALAYDFYTVCLHKVKAKTNFSYHSSLIESMINSYYQNNNMFDPSSFINSV